MYKTHLSEIANKENRILDRSLVLSLTQSCVFRPFSVYVNQ